MAKVKNPSDYVLGKRFPQYDGRIIFVMSEIVDINRPKNRLVSAYFTEESIRFLHHYKPMAMYTTGAY